MQGYSLRYLDSAMSVNRFTSRSFIPYILADFGNGTVRTIKQSTTSTTVGNLKFDIIGTLTGSLTEFSGYKLISNDTHQYLGTASEKNAPLQQNIGDIQSSADGLMKTGSISSFIFDPNVVSKLEQDKSTIYTFKNSGMNNIGLNQRLPAMYGGQIWSFKDGGLVSSSISPGSLVMSIQTLTPVSVTRIKTIVCPVASVIQATGCYSCDIGSKVIIKAKSSCSAGFATVDSLTSGIVLRTLVLSLLNSETEFEVGFYTDKVINNIVLRISGESDHQDLSFSFAAVENVTLRNNTNQNGTFIDANPASGTDFDSWSDFINGAFGIGGVVQGWNTVIFFAVLLAAGGLTGIMIWQVIKMCSFQRMMKMA